MKSAAAEPAAANGVPEAPDASVTLPFKLPQSMLLAAIRNEEVRRLLSEEEALRRQRSELKDTLRSVQDTKDKSIRELKPKTDKFNTDLNTALADLHARKDDLYRQLDELRTHQDKLTHTREELRSQGFTLATLNRDIYDAEMIMRDEQRELDRLEAAKDSARAVAQRKRVEKFTATLKQKTAERTAIEAERAVLREEMNKLTAEETPEQRTERFRATREQIDEVQAKLAELKRQRMQKPEDSTITELQNKQSDIYRELIKTEGRLDAIRRDALPCRHFTYPADARMEIIGRSGATLRQLQLDFGVAICVDMVPPGHGFVMGGEADVVACLAAIDELVQGAVEQEVETDTVRFDPAVKRQIIGSRGSVIDGLERESGARLKVKDDCVEIRGTADAVDAARSMLRAFIDNLGTGEMPFDGTRMNQIVGRGGATIQRVEKESGVRSLRVDRQQNRLMAIGSQTAIAKAFAMYKEILGEVEGGSAFIQANGQLTRSVIGSKGKVVRHIEEATGARVNCGNGTTIRITGAPDAVKAAKERIEELRRSEVRVPSDGWMLNFLTSLVVNVEPGEDTGHQESGSHTTTTVAGPSTGKRISPLEAVQRATGCDQVVPVRSEGVVVIRGRPELAQRAATMVKQLLLRNPPHTLRVPFPDVLRSYLVRRQTNERGSSLLHQVSKNYSPLLHIDLDRDTRTLHVRSNDPDEAKGAAQELSGILKDISTRQIRIMEDFPEDKFGQLIGPGGSRIRELQSDTGTEIAVVRDLNQVQIFSAEADTEALDRAVEQIRRTVLDGGDAELREGNGGGRA